jgi:hypothetical protein
MFFEGNPTPAHVKIATLCLGLSFPLDLFVDVKAKFYANQYVYGRTSKGALRTHRLPQALRLGNGVISAVLRRSNSPYSLKVDDERVFLVSDGSVVTELGLPERPAYFGNILSNGVRTEDFIAVAGEVIPGFLVYPDCHYFATGKPCKFCSLRHARKTAGKEMADRFDLDIVAEATAIFQHTPWKDIPIISITTGTFPDGDEGARYTSRVIRAVYDALNPKLAIHLLTMPPDSFELMYQYRESGVTSIAFNLEVFDQAVFEEVCPGKAARYGYDKLLHALEYAVNVFGPYNVFCGFVWGIETVESTIEGYHWCLDRGIAVSSNVFHADQGSAFANRPHPDEQNVLSLCRAQSRLYEVYPDTRPIFPVSMRSTLDWEIYRGDFR